MQYTLHSAVHWNVLQCTFSCISLCICMYMHIYICICICICILFYMYLYFYLYLCLKLYLYLVHQSLCTAFLMRCTGATLPPDVVLITLISLSDKLSEIFNYHIIILSSLYQHGIKNHIIIS